jgi:RimJ/RimL family protein N-acetyltransferase
VATSNGALETNRLIVRRYEPSDAPFVLDMYSRWDVVRFLGPAPKIMHDIEEASSAIERWRSISDSNPVLGRWAMTLRNGEKVGTVLLKMAPLSSEQVPAPLSGDHEIGWHLHPEHRGHGYATEAASAVLRRAFAGGVADVIALVHPENERSKQVAARLGMEYMGVTTRYYSVAADLYLARPTAAT